MESDGPARRGVMAIESQIRPVCGPVRKRRGEFETFLKTHAERPITAGGDALPMIQYFIAIGSNLDVDQLGSTVVMAI